MGFAFLIVHGGDRVRPGSADGEVDCARVQIGTTKGAKSSLHHLAQGLPQDKSAWMNKADGQLEFQSTIYGLTLSSRLCGKMAARRARRSFLHSSFTAN